MANPGLGLGVIAGADVDDIVELGIAQEARAGERADERHLGGRRDRLRRGEVGVPTGPISAKTLSSSISFLVATIDFSGS